VKKRVTRVFITVGRVGDQVDEIAVDIGDGEMLTVSVDDVLTIVVKMRDRSEVEVVSAAAFLALLQEVLSRIEDRLALQFGETGRHMLDAPIAVMSGRTFRGIVSAGFGCQCRHGIPDLNDLDSMTCPVHRAPRLIEVDDTNE